MMNVDFLAEGRGDVEYIVKTLPDILKFKGLERYVYFWTEWNTLIEKHTDKRYNVEVIDEDERKFISQFIEPKMVYSNYHYNTWKKTYRYKAITLDDISKGKIKDNFIKKMKQYGY